MEARDGRLADAQCGSRHPSIEIRSLTGLVVVDASVAIHAVLSDDGFGAVGPARFVAPALLWSDVTSALHELQYRGAVSPQVASTALRRFLDAPIERRHTHDLHEEAWPLADTLGWSKTYDAEYIVLARRLGARLATVDARLRRTAARLVTTVGPTEI